MLTNQPRIENEPGLIMDKKQRFALRAYERPDAREVARVWFDSWQSTGLSDGSTTQRLTKRLLDEAWDIVVAHEADVIVGFVAYEPEPRWLRQLFVRPEHKREGVGRLLLMAAKRAMPKGFWLRTQVQNTAARRFYETCGLLCAGEQPHPKTSELIVKYVWDGV